MRPIDADAIFPWYVEAFKGEIEPHDVRFSMLDIKMNLSNIPTIDAVPVRHGKWIGSATEDCDCRYVRCDQCQKVLALYYGKPNPRFCPDCGARMDKDE